jgi:hypothetical protein
VKGAGQLMLTGLITLKILSLAKDAQRLRWLADVRFRLTSEVPRIV